MLPSEILEENGTFLIWLYSYRGMFLLWRLSTYIFLNIYMGYLSQIWIWFLFLLPLGEVFFSQAQTAVCVFLTIYSEMHLDSAL